MISEDHRRSILQFLLLERMMTFGDFTDLICRVVGNSDVRTDSLIESINEKIRRFSQKIVITSSEITGEKIVVLASTADHAEIKSPLTKDQIDYFYHLMDDIINKSGSVTKMIALNSAPLRTSGRITIGEAEKVIDSFISKKMLISEHGYLFLSPLTIVELGPYISENYELPNCILCKKTMIVGGYCPHCNGPTHSPCAQAYIGNKQQVKCPNPQCKKEWNRDNIEEAIVQ